MPFPELATLMNEGLAGELVASHFDGWGDRLKDEFKLNRFNGQVGGALLFEDPCMRIWAIDLAPGERLPAHCHVLDYSWTALTAGESTQRTSDGTTRRVSYERGDQKFFAFGRGEYLLHDLENTGRTRLRFLTAEFLDSDNRPLDIGSEGDGER